MNLTIWSQPESAMLLLVIPIFNVSFTAFVIVVLGVWRITHLLWGEDGPGDIFVRLRRAAGKRFFGRLLDCFYCLSLWVAAPFALAFAASWLECAVLWIGLSGGAILLERATERTPKPPPAIWHETPILDQEKEEESTDVMLR